MWLRTTIFLSIFAFSCPQDDTSRTLAELQLNDLELVDQCEELAKLTKQNLHSPNYQKLLDEQIKLGGLARTHSESLAEFPEPDQSALRNYTFLRQPGDLLLGEADWFKLNSFAISCQALQNNVTIPCNNTLCNFSKRQYLDIMENTQEMALLAQTWSLWQRNFLPVKGEFDSVLRLVAQAAQLNEQTDVRTYWEWLNELPGGYTTLNHTWTEIQPFYDKLHEFVRKRLNQSDLIPVFALQGHAPSWSQIAGQVLPHPQFHFDAQKLLQSKSLHEVYKMVENLTVSLKLGGFETSFWAGSRFDLDQCQARLLAFCASNHSEVFTCNRADWVNFIEALKVGGAVVLRRDYGAWMREKLRFSAAKEAVQVLMVVLGVEMLEGHAFKQESLDTKLLLLALELVAPLPYYVVADQWRLAELEAPSSDDSTKNWWSFRNKIQGVSGVDNTEPDFLSDDLMASNQPYLSKYLGTLIAFQIIEFYRAKMADPMRDSLLVAMQQDDSLLALLKDLPTNDWAYLMSLHFEINEVSSGALLNYFKPLEEYFESAPLEQAAIIESSSTTEAALVVKNTPRGVSLQGKANDWLNDDNKLNATRSKDGVEGQGYSTGTYFGIGMLVLLSCIMLSALAYKKFKKRKLPHNRRFEE